MRRVQEQLQILRLRLRMTSVRMKSARRAVSSGLANLLTCGLANSLARRLSESLLSEVRNGHQKRAGISSEFIFCQRPGCEKRAICTDICSNMLGIFHNCTNPGEIHIFT